MYSQFFRSRRTTDLRHKRREKSPRHISRNFRIRMESIDDISQYLLKPAASLGSAILPSLSIVHDSYHLFGSFAGIRHDITSSPTKIRLMISFVCVLPYPSLGVSRTGTRIELITHQVGSVQTVHNEVKPPVRYSGGRISAIVTESRLCVIQFGGLDRSNYSHPWSRSSSPGLLH
jgi:hypothetical protein